MGSLRSCVFLLVMLVQFQVIIGKPFFFFDSLCDYLCDDDDDVTTTASTNNDDDWDVFGLCTCGTRQPPRQNQGIPPNINMRLPPSANGMNFSMSNNNGLWSFNLDAGPNGPPGGIPPGGIPPGGIPPAAGAGGPATPPPAAGATTPAATTAAATTAKK